jgi:hypothetical protein
MFVFGETLEKAIEAIPEEYQLRFYRMIKDYGLHGIEPELAGFELSTWVTMKTMIDITIPKRNNASPVGKVGAPFGNLNAQKTKNNQNNYDELFSKNNSENNQNNSSDLLNVNVNDNVNVNENVNDSSGSAEPPGKKPSSRQKPTKPPLRERAPVNDMEKVEKAYLLNWDTLYSRKQVETPDPIVNWGQARKQLKTHFEKLKPEQIIQAINNGMNDEWTLDKGYSLAIMLSASVLNRLINAVQKEPPVPANQQHKKSL